MNCMTKSELLRKVQEACFYAYDLQLYLDTHPTDVKAMQLFTNPVAKKQELVNIYESKYGPLTADKAAGKMPWQWIDSPWSWQ